MKAEELRIGNFIRANSDKVEERVIRVDTRNINNCTLGYYEEVPLDLAYVKNSRFVRVQARAGVAMAFKLKNVRINMSNSGNFYYNKLPIYSVHQLQNLYFALTTEEL